MKTIRYENVIDKSDWPRGPWDFEPDKIQWKDAATGFPCLMVRTPHHGAWCGYVGVPKGHLWHGQGYDDVRWNNPNAEDHWDLHPTVHGGLTFAGGCSHDSDPAKGICHVPEEGEPNDVWWLGFDTAHYQDRTPGMEAIISRTGAAYLREHSTYRDETYVKGEVTKLAAQAALAMEKTDEED